jgi:hypothetical protein
MATDAAVSALLIEHGTKGLESQLKHVDPFYEKIKHVKAKGDPESFAVETGQSPGAAHEASVAEGNAAYASRAKYQIVAGRSYVYGQIDHHDARRCMTAEALDDLIKREVETVKDTMGNKMKFAVWDNGDSVRGVIATGGISGATVTLTNATDTRNFYPDQVVEAAATAGGATLSGSVTVASVDPDAGTVTFTGNYTTGISSGAVGDNLFQQGDSRNNTDALIHPGIPAWMPSSTPGSTLFYGVDRSTAPDLLAGVRSDQSSAGDRARALKKAAAAGRTRSFGQGMYDCIFMSEDQFEALSSELEARGNDAFKSEFGHDGLKLNIPGLTAEVYPAPLLTGDIAYMLTTSKWECVYWGDSPIEMLGMRDSGHFERTSGANFRFGFEAAMALRCLAPLKQVIVTLPSL